MFVYWKTSSLKLQLQRVFLLHEEPRVLSVSWSTYTPTDSWFSWFLLRTQLSTQLCSREGNSVSGRSAPLSVHCWFSQFYYNMPDVWFSCVQSVSPSVDGAFHQLWELLRHVLVKYCFCSIFSHRSSHDKHKSDFLTVSVSTLSSIFSIFYLQASLGYFLLSYPLGR